MPVVAELALIDRKSADAMVVLRYACRDFRLIPRLITNFMRLADPAPLRLESGKSINVKMSTHATIITLNMIKWNYGK